MQIKQHRFPYLWEMRKTKFTKDKGKVFSCFSAGGGSTMGYKLAGFDVIGCLDIDPKMLDVYRANHKPKYSYLGSIVDLVTKKDLPAAMYNLDILDGSPPCSSFSMSGNREKDWGKDKVFREGQKKQILDTLFFDFIALAKRLQPKIVVAENVKGILMGNAKDYAIKIHGAFDDAGYTCYHWILDSSKMGVPQKRERVFFIALRNDLVKKVPRLMLKFNEPEIPFKFISDNSDTEVVKETVTSSFYKHTQPGKSFSLVHPKGNMFNWYRAHPDKVLPTITSSHKSWHHTIKRFLNKKEITLAGSFPQDYNYMKNKNSYVIGMSVPPVMMANIAMEIYKQWISKLNN